LEIHHLKARQSQMLRLLLGIFAVARPIHSLVNMELPTHLFTAFHT
jgi:hypothetical protein